MIFVQIILGGITRLTESGLSIVRWDLITGIVPPLNEDQWLTEFERYQETPHAIAFNPDMCMCDFKTIFMWEWAHRLWGRMIGLVFIIPFVIFLARRMMSRALIGRTLVALALGAAIGVFGWIMVKSGLVAEPMVSPYLLAVHMGLAIITLSYVLWLALLQLVWKTSESYPGLRRWAIAVAILIGVQIIFGALMSGTEAARFYTTWPTMNGKIIPANILDFDSGYYPVTFIQFTHRLIGYALVIMIALLAIKAIRSSVERSVKMHIAVGMSFMVVLQIALGVLTLAGTRTGTIPIDRALAHQALGVIMLMSMVYVVYRLRVNDIVKQNPSVLVDDALK